MGNDHGSIKRVVIFGNGNLDALFLRELSKGDYVIGVDRAAYWLLSHGITPDLAIGDFDSATPREMSSIAKAIRLVKKYKPEKDQTDMELAVAFAEKLKPAEVIIYGATGTRVDHLLATLHLLKNHIIVDKNNRIRVIGRGKTIIKRASYKYLSVIPYTKSISLSLAGFKYNLARKTIRLGTTLGVSNEIIRDTGEITVHAGRAWVIESND